MYLKRKIYIGKKRERYSEKQLAKGGKHKDDYTGSERKKTGGERESVCVNKRERKGAFSNLFILYLSAGILCNSFH